MADVSSSRANKLAAARKKLREFKQARHYTSGNGKNIEQKTEPVDQAHNNYNTEIDFAAYDSTPLIKTANSSENDLIDIPDSNRQLPSLEQSDYDPFQSSTSNNPGRLSKYFDDVKEENQSRFVELNTGDHPMLVNGSINVNHDDMNIPMSVADEYLINTNGNQLQMTSGTKNSQLKNMVQELEELKLTNMKLMDTVNAYDQEKEMNLLVSGPLKEQLQSQAQTIGILVAEKTELQSALSQSQATIYSKTSEVEELITKTQQMQQQIQVLEQQLNEKENYKSNLLLDHDELSSKILHLEKAIDNLKREITVKDEVQQELQNKLDRKNSEMSDLQSKFISIDNELQLAKIRICQLSSHEDNESLSQIQQDKTELVKQIAHYKESFLKLESEKEEIVKNYNDQVGKLKQTLQNADRKVGSLEKESSFKSKTIDELNLKVTELEKQTSSRWREKLQEEWCQEKMKFMSSINNLQQENDQLVQCKHSLEVDIQSLNLAIQKYQSELKESESKQTEYDQLMITMESDKVAASRATSQNLILKKQNEEYEKAHSDLTKEKTELLEMISMKDVHLNESHDQIAKLEELNLASRQEMIDLQVLNNKLSKQLEELQLEIVDVKNHNLKQSVETNPVAVMDENRCSDKETVPMADYCNLQLAMEALEVKFNESIRKVANLTEENHVLEHIVTQLHSETETIEEYIALYRMQRGLLRQKAEEKDQIIQQISQDREMLRNKLSKLEDLVNKLSLGQNIVVGQEDSNAPLVDKVQEIESANEADIGTDMDTTKQIKALLSEIGASSILQNNLVSENFHPCGLCYGKLQHL